MIPQALCSCQYRCKRGFDASRFSCRQALGMVVHFPVETPTESSAPLSHLYRDHRQAGISMCLPGWRKVSVLQQGESFQNMSDVRRDADRPPPRNLQGTAAAVPCAAVGSPRTAGRRHTSPHPGRRYRRTAGSWPWDGRTWGSVAPAPWGSACPSVLQTFCGRSPRCHRSPDGRAWSTATGHSPPWV